MTFLSVLKWPLFLAEVKSRLINLKIPLGVTSELITR